MDVEVICIDDEEEDGEIFSQQEEQEPDASGTAASRSPAATAAAGTTIDLTESAPPTFEQEYEALRSSAMGFVFPFEAVAELLLRHPDHWWCRCVWGVYLCRDDLSEAKPTKIKAPYVRACRVVTVA